MLHSQLLTGLLSENEDTLKQQIKLWDDSGVWTTLGLLAQSKVDQYLHVKLPYRFAPDDPWNGLSEVKIQDFQLMKLSRLMSAAGVSFPSNPTPPVLHENCLEVEQCAIDYLTKEDEDFKGSTIPELTAFVMKKMFTEFTKKFHDAPQDQQEDIAEQLLDAVDQLDDVDRQRFLNELGVEKLSTGQLKKLIASGTFATAFAASVSVTGFTAYLGITTALSAVSALLGITFPFVVYMYATATIAFLANPIVLATVGVGLGAWITSRSNKTILRRLLPTVVAFSTISSADASDTETSLSHLVNHIGRRQGELSSGEKKHIKVLNECFPGVAS